MTPRHLFVYGTLMHGQDQAALVGSGRRTPATVRGRLFALPAGYPAMQPGGDAQVHGELVAFSDERTLALLDHYEGVHEGLYQRVAVDAVVGLRRIQAWAWVMDDPHLRGGRIVASGRWTAARRR